MLTAAFDASGDEFTNVSALVDSSLLVGTGKISAGCGPTGSLEKASHISAPLMLRISMENLGRGRKNQRKNAKLGERDYFAT